MNRLSFFLLLTLLFLSQSVYMSASSTNTPIDIYVSFRNPYPEKGPIMRTPPKMPNVYLTDYLVTFDAFGSACTLELVDTETNETIYTQVVPAGGISCL